MLMAAPPPPLIPQVCVPGCSPLLLLTAEREFGVAVAAGSEEAAAGLAGACGCALPPVPSFLHLLWIHASCVARISSPWCDTRSCHLSLAGLLPRGMEILSPAPSALAALYGDGQAALRGSVPPGGAQLPTLMEGVRLGGKQMGKMFDAPSHALPSLSVLLPALLESEMR
jgi:hypothetical protein